MTEQHELSAHPEAPERSSGIAVISEHPVENPGFPPERPRVTDLDPKQEKGQERRIVALFFVSIIGSVAAIALYILFPIIPGDMQSVRNNTMFVGLAIALALLAIGVGVVHWSKALMHGHDLVEERHATRGSEATRGRAPLPAVVLLRDLAPAADPVPLLKHTMWDKGVRLTRDPSGTPIRAADVTLGSAFHVIPEGLNELEHGRLEEKAKAAVLLMRLKPEDLHVSPEREDWNFRGIVAYSKICTHVGCPVALYEQQTHHLLCPCHQSQFDITREARVIFGPAKRPLPQLPITVDDDGYLVARSDFTEPVGPSFWERVL